MFSVSARVTPTPAHAGSSGTSQALKAHFHFYLCGWRQQLFFFFFLITTAHWARLFKQPRETEATARLGSLFLQSP